MPTISLPSILSPQDAPAAADLVIAGGGLAGLSLAAALGGVGLRVVVVDREPPEAALVESFDLRTSAIAGGCQRVLAASGVWRHLGGEAEPIRDVRVSDGRVGEPASPLFLHYGQDDLSGEPDAEGQRHMGFIVENRRLRQALLARLAELSSVTLVAPATVAGIEPKAAGVRVELAGGGSIRADLMVAVDGKESRLRQAAGIGVARWNYPQSGIVATLVHDEPHHGTAHEHFLPSGPFAMLPMTDGADGPDGEARGGEALHRSSLVWTERRERVAEFMTLTDEAFGRACEQRFGLSLGRLRPIGGRFAYPLSFLLADQFHAPRLALLGEAAHAVHPIAGQGFNLSLRDIAALAEAVVDAARLGLDIGGEPVLERYARWRRFDTLLMGAVTDGLNRLFSNDLAPVRLTRDLGLAAVGRLPPLKRFFVRHAMGVVGELPRLVRGEAL